MTTISKTILTLILLNLDQKVEMSEKIQLNTPVFYISLSNLIDSYGQSQVKYNAMNDKCDNFTLFPSAVC